MNFCFLPQLENGRYFQRQATSVCSQCKKRSRIVLAPQPPLQFADVQHAMGTSAFSQTNFADGVE